VALGVLALPVAALASAALGYGAARATGLDPVFRPWVASPAPLVAAFFLSGVAGAALPALLLGGRAGSAGLRHGIRVCLAALSVALAATLPGASYLLLVPAMVGALAGIAAEVAGGDRWAEAGDLATLLAAAVVLLPPAWLLYPGLGHVAGAPAAAVVAVVALPLAPIAAALSLRRRAVAAVAPALLGGVALATALALPVADLDSPERVILYFHQEAGKERAQVLAYSDLGRLPGPVRSAAPFSAEPRVALAWGQLRPSFVADVDRLPIGGPEVEVLQAARDGKTVRARLRIHSPRGAPDLQVAVPPTARVVSFTFDGLPVPAPVRKLSRWYGGYWVYRLPARPGGVEVSLEAESPEPLEIGVADQSPGLPPAAQAVAAARPPGVVTLQEGDVTLFTRTVRLDEAR
jgi:hypothetical protein